MENYSVPRQKSTRAAWKGCSKLKKKRMAAPHTSAYSEPKTWNWNFLQSVEFWCFFQGHCKWKAQSRVPPRTSLLRCPPWKQPPTTLTRSTEKITIACCDSLFFNSPKSSFNVSRSYYFIWNHNNIVFRMRDSCYQRHMTNESSAGNGEDTRHMDFQRVNIYYFL